MPCSRQALTAVTPLLLLLKLSMRGRLSDNSLCLELPQSRSILKQRTWFDRISDGVAAAAVLEDDVPYLECNIDVGFRIDAFFSSVSNQRLFTLICYVGLFG